jgi:formylglycine-generating enzyme required for sulfatase activity
MKSYPLLLTTLGATTLIGAAALGCFRNESRPYSRTAPSSADPATLTPAEMKFIPGGTAVIGVTEEFIQNLRLEADNEIKYMAGSYPEKRDVQIEALYLDTTEVTNEQWKAYLDATGQKPNDTLVAEYWRDGSFPRGEGKRPITYISHTEATAFARWALKRLPTEFEWEYAARGADGLVFPWGNDFDDEDPDAKFDRDGKRLTDQQILDRKAKYEGMKIRKGVERVNCGATPGKREPADVAKYVDGASAFGIHDLCGNVWEWTASPYTAYDVKNAEISIKTSLTKGEKKKFNAAQFFNSEQRVVRGGAFNADPKALFSAYRQGASRGDVVRAAAEDFGSFVFRNSPLDLNSIWGQEHIVYDKDGLIRGAKHFAFAPAQQYLKEGKALARLSDFRKEAEKGPQYIGLITSDSAFFQPLLPKGVYAVAYLAKSDSLAKAQKDMTFVDDGWYWSGMQVDPKKAVKKKEDKKDKKKGAKEGEEAAEGEDAASSAEDPNAAAAAEGLVDFVPQPGSVIVDRSRDHIILLDVKTTIVAALPVGTEMKELNPIGEMKLERLMVKEDTVRKTPAFERLTWKFGMQIQGKKVVTFDLPLAFKLGAFDAPPPYVAAAPAAAAAAGAK